MGASLCLVTHPYEYCLVLTRWGASLCLVTHPYEDCLVLTRWGASLCLVTHPYESCLVLTRRGASLCPIAHPYEILLVPTRRGASLCPVAHPYETFLVPTRRGAFLCSGAHPHETGSCLRLDCCVPYKSYPVRRRCDCVKCDLVLARVFPPLRSLRSDPLHAQDLSSPKSSVYQISSMAIMPGFGRE